MMQMLRDAGRDVALAVRLLKARPGFGVVVLLTLGLGIGAPTAVFSVVHAVLLRPLPYPDADRLVRFRIESRNPSGVAGFDALPATTALRWDAEGGTLAGLALYNDRALTLSTSDGPQRLTGIAGTPNLFEIVGVAPVIGRTFDAGTRDDKQIVLSHETWERFFGARTGIVDSVVTLDGDAYRIVGVMPKRFEFPTPETAFWVPLVLDSGGSRGMLLPAIGRLRPDASVAAVRDEGRRLLSENRGPRENETLIVRTLQEQLVGGIERTLWVLLGAVGVVASIATANMALLLLVRGSTRAPELSIRLAIGARRAQLVRQLFVEAMTLAWLGGMVGVLLAFGLLEILLRSAPSDVPRLHEVALDLPVLTFALLVTTAAGLVFGILSAGRTIAIDPARALAGSGLESRLLGVRSTRSRMHALVAAELALTMVLLVGAALLMRTFIDLVLVDQGFHPRGALALRVSLPAARYPSAEARLAFHERLLERLAAIDSIDAAGLITSMPNRQPSGRFAFDASRMPQVQEPLTLQIAEVRMATEGFFEAMGVPLLAGRTFRPQDAPGSEDVIVLSQQLARVHFPNDDAVGRVLYSGGAGTVRVIGVVGDVRPAAGGEPQPAAYLPLRQDAGILQWYASINVLARGRDTVAIGRDVRAVVASLDPELPVFSVRTLGEEVSSLVAGPRFVASVLASFALIALTLAAVGVYGVMAYSAGQRTREIGVRVALGATRGQVLRLMLRDGLVVIGAGLGIGLLAALWLAQGLIGLLHDVRPSDPISLSAVAFVLAAAGLLAAYVPARRATRVSPLDALRDA